MRDVAIFDPEVNRELEAHVVLRYRWGVLSETAMSRGAPPRSDWPAFGPLIQ
jgi:hypothetical protein